MASPVKDAVWLEWMTRLMGQPATPGVRRQAFDRSRFYCLLDEQPTHLVPQWFRMADAAKYGSDGPLIVNPGCHFSGDGELPPAVADCTWLQESLALGSEMVWVTDVATEAVQPFWLGEEFSNLLNGCRPGEVAPEELPQHARTVLAAAGVLVEPDHVSQRRREWAEAISHCRRHFQKGYVPIGGLLHPFQLAALRRYFRRLIRKGVLTLGDESGPRRYGAYNDGVARFFHQQLAAAVADIVGQPVKPSYVYFASYQSGAQLHRHVDREQCEFSITLCLDYSPEPVRETPWPLHLDTEQSKVTVYQALGDGLVYRGRELPHYRDPLPPGNTSSSIFFHYVRESFAGSLV
jgi:hypothetical protein